MQPASVASRVLPKPTRPASKPGTPPVVAAKPSPKPGVPPPPSPKVSSPAPKVSAVAPSPKPGGSVESAPPAAPPATPPKIAHAPQRFSVAVDWEGSFGCHIVTASSFPVLQDRVQELSGSKLIGFTYGPSSIVVDSTPALLGIVDGVLAGTDKGTPLSAPKIRAHLGDPMFSKRKLEQKAYQDMKEGKAS